jgi:hypothetical protein
MGICFRDTKFASGGINSTFRSPGQFRCMLQRNSYRDLDPFRDLFVPLKLRKIGPMQIFSAA